jgi:hypothetical protein
MALRAPAPAASDQQHVARAPLDAKVISRRLEPGGMAAYVDLRLDADLAHPLFEAWRLADGGGAAAAGTGAPLPAAAVAPEARDADYVHACHAALHNHLAPTADGAGAYLFAGEPNEELLLLEARPGGGAPTLRQVCALERGKAPAGGAAGVGAPLAPSVVAVAGVPGGRLLLVSTGGGDLRAVLDGGVGGAAEASAAAWPLRPAPPLAGARPFVLAAACWRGGGEALAVLWAVRPRGGPAAPARAEAYAVRLRLGEEPGAAAPEALALQLLAASPAPLFGALADAATGAVLLVLEPAPEEEEEEEKEEEECGDGAGAERPPIDEGGDLSPRSLAAAAAALEKYTADEDAGPAGGAPADLLGGGAGRDADAPPGAEPACKLAAFEPAVGGAAAVGGAFLRRAGGAAGGPHRFLGCHPAPGGGGRLALLLTHDVDAALLEVGAAGGGVDESDSDPQFGARVGAFAARHVASVPALAYVAAGKPSRRFLLAAAAPARPGAAAAALVEARRHAFLYAPAPPGARRGEQRLTELAPGGALGAALVPGPGGVGARLLLLHPDRVAELGLV